MLRPASPRDDRTEGAQRRIDCAQAAHQQSPAARWAQIAAPLFATLLAASTVSARELQGEGLGSTWKVTIADKPAPDAETIRRGIQQQIDNVTRQLSRWDSKSSLSSLNAATTDDWRPLPNELFTALSYALELAESTRGAYDPTVAPLVDVWGFGTPGRRFAPPSAQEIGAARARVGWQKIALDSDGKRVRRPAGMLIDLSSMTHGLAADQVASYLQSIGVKRYLIDVGSELRAQGDAPDEKAWRVGIEKPPAELAGASSPEPLRVVALRDAGIATSGNYRYYFDYNGRRYSHRIDPRTGEPVANDLASVTVIAPQCMHADALATALTVMGPDEGLAYAQRHDIAALFVLRKDNSLEQRMTPQFRAYLD